MAWFSLQRAASWTVSRQVERNPTAQVLSESYVTLRARHKANRRFLCLFLHQFLDNSFNFSLLVALDLESGSLELQKVFFLGFLWLVIYWPCLLFHCWDILWIVFQLYDLTAKKDSKGLFELICCHCRVNIKLKSELSHHDTVIRHIFLVILTGSQVDVVSMAKLDEPTFWSFERACFAKFNGKFSDLFLVS